MDNLASTMIHEMARRSGTEVTDEHWSILGYAYDYYKKNRVGPLYPNIRRHTGASKADIARLFPAGLSSVYVWVGIPIHSPDQNCKPLATVKVDSPREVYLDHNATTYIRDEVKDLLVDHHRRDDSFGNPSSSTELGRRAHRLVEAAREQVASCLGVNSEEIVFTGGGSAADNLAIKGVAFQHLARPGHLITSRTEHAAVLASMAFLETLGFEVTYLDVAGDGRVRPEDVARSLRDDTILVSIMAVNNEIGVINPFEEIAGLCRDAGVPFMTDAVQAFGKLPLAPKSSGISMLAISGHKIYAPKGIGALFVDEGQPLLPLIHGGGQERGRRAGTENVAAIMALGHAAKLAHRERESEHRRMCELRDYFLARLSDVAPGAIVNGSLEHRVPGNLNIGFPNIDSGSLLLSLNQIGIYVSSGSACHAGSVEASHVIAALGVDTEQYGTIRFSMGRRTDKADLDYLFAHLGELLALLAK